MSFDFAGSSKLAVFGAVLITAGCSSPGLDVDRSVAPLPDVNPTSPTYDRDVHPDDFAGEISAWYFGHAT